jgi:hypothetical protein
VAAGTISPAAVLRDARSFDKLRSALLRMRLLMGEIRFIPSREGGSRVEA